MAGNEPLLLRLRSFSPLTWFGKPGSLSPLQCAAKGWRNTGPDTLTCDACGSKIICLLPASPELSSSVVTSYVGQLSAAHNASCPWRKPAAAAAAAAAHPAGSQLLRFPLLPTATLLGSYRQRLQQLQQLEVTPRVAAAVLQRLAAATQQLDPALLQALADLVEMPLEALRQQCCQQQQQQPVGSAIGSSSSSSGGGGHAAVLRKQQAQALLALCGWQVGQLLPPQLAADAARPSAYSVSHLLPRASPGPVAAAASSSSSAAAAAAGGSSSANPAAAGTAAGAHASLQSIGCAQAMLLCELCGSRIGLWQFIGSGPFYAQQVASRAAAAVAAANSAVGAADSQQAAAAAAGGGGGHTAQVPSCFSGSGAAAAGGAPSAATAAVGQQQQQQQAAAAASEQQQLDVPHSAMPPSPAVAASLHHTIAGGSLLSPAAAAPSAAAAQSGWGSPSPVRAGSAGFFRSPSPRLSGPFGASALPAFGSSPAGLFAAAPFGSRPAGGGGGGGGGGGPFGLPAAASSAGDAAEAAVGGGPAAVFGLSALKDREQRTKMQQQQQQQQQGGQAAGQSSSSSMVPAVMGFLRSPNSSKAAAEEVGAGVGVGAGPAFAMHGSVGTCFDPIAQHRSWCPWVHREAAQHQQAATPAASAASSGDNNKLAGSVWDQGWSSTLLALLEEREDQQLLSGAWGPAADGEGGRKDSAALIANARHLMQMQ